jgi:hypothetical protein
LWRKFLFSYFPLVPFVFSQYKTCNIHTIAYNLHYTIPVTIKCLIWFRKL